MKMIPRAIHPYHLVEASPWPLFMSFSLLSLAIGFATWITNLQANLLPQFLLVGFVAILWWKDVLRESAGGYHTIVVQKGITIGFLLFLISEIMLFFSFFWAFFHSSLAPAVDIGSVWPPEGINAVNPWAIPLFGSCVLLASGFVLTLSHHAMILGKKDLALITMLITVLLGFLFIFLQANEYQMGEFTIADSIFGNVFYMTTGLHAIHVIAGVTFLTVGLIRMYFDSFTTEHHLGLEFAIFYWHIVDVIWLFVFFLFYWWGS
uniref:Cytochrome c oxidase subunit 3 n=1 Tax=Synchytrium taraxaci TaxID=1383262 RepID=A0A4P8NQJ5_9FUNG|nr:cytochrome c oxidase subunit 3 [Synchytrium taraxaci]